MHCRRAGVIAALHESGDTLTVTTLLHGNDFPNSELFVQDTAGNSVFLNGFETSGGRQTGPFLHLAGEGKEMLGGQRDTQIKLDKAGHFMRLPGPAIWSFSSEVF